MRPLHRATLLGIRTRLQTERDKLVDVLNPMPVHAQPTNQLEQALKSLDVAVGLIDAARDDRRS